MINFTTSNARKVNIYRYTKDAQMLAFSSQERGREEAGRYLSNVYTELEANRFPSTSTAEGQHPLPLLREGRLCNFHSVVIDRKTLIAT